MADAGERETETANNLTTPILPVSPVIEIINEEPQKLVVLRPKTPYVNDGFTQTEERSTSGRKTHSTHSQDGAYEVVEFRSDPTTSQTGTKRYQNVETTLTTDRDNGVKPKTKEKLTSLMKRKSLEMKNVLKWILLVLTPIAFAVYFVLAVIHKFGDEGSIILLVCTSVSALYVVWRFAIMKLCSPICKSKSLLNQAQRKKLYRFLNMSVCLAGIFGSVIYLAVDILRNRPENFVPGAGLIMIVLLAYLFSKHIHAVTWKPVLWGLLLQLFLALVLHRWRYGYAVLRWLEQFLTDLLSHANVGQQFLFGLTENHILIFKVFTATAFVYALASMLLHLGVTQFILRTVSSWISSIVGTSPVESLTVFTNIFFDQSQSLSLIRNYFEDLTMSELHTVFVGGFATMSIGHFLVLSYLEISIRDVLIANLISAPAAITISKLLYPETKCSVTSIKHFFTLQKGKATNVLEAISDGAIRSVKVVLYIVVNTIVFMAFLHLADSILIWIGRRVGFVDLTGYELTFQYLCSLLFWPVSYLMGVDHADQHKVAGLLGVKTFLNENLAFVELSRYIQNRQVCDLYSNKTSEGNMTVSCERRGNVLFLGAENRTLVGGIISKKSEVIATYVLSGSASFVSVGLVLGVIAAIAPERKSDASKIIFRALMAGLMINIMSGFVIGMLYND